MSLMAQLHRDESGDLFEVVSEPAALVGELDCRFGRLIWLDVTAAPIYDYSKP